jgi:hypothetical protein
MDATVFGFTNNSDENQDIDLFQSSDLGAVDTLEYVWNFSYNWGNYGVNPAYNIATGLWFDTTIAPGTGSFNLRLWQKGGINFSIGLPTSTTLFQNKTTAQVENVFNTDAEYSQVGVWSIIGPIADEEGALSIFNIRVIPSQAFISANKISVSPRLNYGVQSMAVDGLGGPPFWTSGIIYPKSSAVSPSLVTNPNVSVVSSSNFSYPQFLWSTIGRTYDVKNFQLWSTSQNQLLQPFLFDRTLASGRVYQKVLTPSIDPYQSQNYIITPDEKGYILDGFTKIRYTMLPNSTLRLILDYTYVDISTPLIARVSNPKINQSSINPTFVDNMEKGYDKFGCKFLKGRLVSLNEKLKDISGKSGNMHPKWQEHIKSRLMYIKQLMISYDCITKEELEEMPEMRMIGPELVRTNLWMPSAEFVQSQLDEEQGARKLFRNHDFPIEKE